MSGSCSVDSRVKRASTLTMLGVPRSYPSIFCHSIHLNVECHMWWEKEELWQEPRASGGGGGMCGVWMGVRVSVRASLAQGSLPRPCSTVLTRSRRARVASPAAPLTCCLLCQPPHPPLPLTRLARPTNAPSPSRPDPGSSGSTSRPARPTAPVAFRSPMLPTMRTTSS